EEAERRLEQIDSGKVQPIPGDEVFKRIRVRYQKRVTASILKQNRNSMIPLLFTNPKNQD
ncbi:MAG: addiction module protein, partial [Candidatus Lokiarchaeota archaeon]|nr:addiction module protein [Candidatus Lokiarchaeota archaeon]